MSAGCIKVPIVHYCGHYTVSQIVLSDFDNFWYKYSYKNYYNLIILLQVTTVLRGSFLRQNVYKCNVTQKQTH